MIASCKAGSKQTTLLHIILITKICTKNFGSLLERDIVSQHEKMQEFMD